ncbi:MAG TPA: trypsin-like serine protease, partial [Polyangiaceae bacterium]
MTLGVIVLAAIVPLVTHGTSDASDPAVVAIVTSDGVVACSGTVIDPHFVLTAGHCIVPEIAQGASV